MNRPGKFFVVSAPSGAGKTSLVNGLLGRLQELCVSVSYTTRPPRPHDEEGKDYHFITHEEFTHRIALGDFLEYATVYGHYYGTGKNWVLDQLNRGVDVILEIDWQGAKQVRMLFPDATSIFILPPALSVLRDRLLQRGQDPSSVIESRMEKAQQEMAHYAEFDYLVINDDFDHALENLVHIIEAERLKCDLQASKWMRLLADLIETH